MRFFAARLLIILGICRLASWYLLLLLVLPLSAATDKCLDNPQLPWPESCATSKGIARPWQTGSDPVGLKYALRRKIIQILRAYNTTVID